MMYFLIVALVTSAGQNVEVKVEFDSHEACVAKEAEITSNIKRYSGWFGARITSNWCYKT
jgi:hypothetical protein